MFPELLAIDLDGTLLDPRGRISESNLRAIHRAHEAGVIVVPCTGRSWIESRRILKLWPRHDPPHAGVFVTGAAVTDIDTGRSLDVAVIEPRLVRRLVEHLYDLPEAVLIFRDANETGHDYLVTGRGELTDNTRWWFQSQGARVHTERRLSDALCHHVLHVGVVACYDRVTELTRQLRSSFGEDEILLHYFAAVQNPDPQRVIYILEIFAAGVDKWRGLLWLAHQHGIETDRIAVIGDEINDLAMIENAACGIAMANAVDPVRFAADHVTLDNASDGAAHAIEQMLLGNWCA